MVALLAVARLLKVTCPLLVMVALPAVLAVRNNTLPKELLTVMFALPAVVVPRKAKSPDPGAIVKLGALDELLTTPKPPAAKRKMLDMLNV